MGNWTSNRRVMGSSAISALVLCAAAACGSGGVAAQEAAGNGGFSFEFDFFSVDAQSNRGEFKGLTITNGTITLAADEATANQVDFEMSEWELRGHVRIAIDSATITASRATFAFADGALVSGELTGQPATLEDSIPAKNETVRATAERISYDNVGQIARMQGDASLTTGTTQMTGCDILYDLRGGTMDSGSEQCSEPFRIKFLPREPEPTESAAPGP